MILRVVTNSELKHVIQKIVRQKLLEMSSKIPENFEDFRMHVSDVLRFIKAPASIVEDVGFSGRECYSSDAVWLTWHNIQLEMNSSAYDRRKVYEEVSKDYIVRLISDIVDNYNESRSKISELVDPEPILSNALKILRS